MTLVSGKYLHDFLITLNFVSDGKKKKKVIDFLPLFQRYVKGDNLRYFAPGNFKKFTVQSGNISWGKNEDVVFPVGMLIGRLKGSKETEEIVYVI